MAMPADPVKPVSQASRSSEGGDIFVLLLIGAGNHESRQLPPRQLLAECRQPRGKRDAAFGLFECLEMGFEHCRFILGLGGVRNAARISAIWHDMCLNKFRLHYTGRKGYGTGRWSDDTWEASRNVSTQ